MNKVSNIYCVNDYLDVKDIPCDVKYINISINGDNRDVTKYFLDNGNNYYYADLMDNKRGFVYADYDVFKRGEDIINGIISGMPDGLDVIGKARYLYIALGKLVGYDINLLSNKNEVVSLDCINNSTNIWACLCDRKINNVSLVKLFVYLCSRVNIKCDIVNSNVNGNLANRVFIDSGFIIVNLFLDLGNIKGGFVTEYFDKYNSDSILDKKCLYISDRYTDYYLDEYFGNISYNKDSLLYDILGITYNILDIGSISSYELFLIYRKIFDKYFSDYDIRVNNFYLNGDVKKHFIILSYNDCYYSYNYTKNCFVILGYDYLIDKLKNNVIGLYLDEDFNVMKERFAL